MKAFINVLQFMHEEDIEYTLTHEYDQMRISFPRTEDEYMVVTRHEDFHANNVDFLNGDQIDSFLRGVALRQRSATRGNHEIEIE